MPFLLEGGRASRASGQERMLKALASILQAFLRTHRGISLRPWGRRYLADHHFRTWCPPNKPPGASSGSESPSSIPGGAMRRAARRKPAALSQIHRLRIVPVYTPTDASWLSLIEPQLGVAKNFTLSDTDDPNHRTRRRRIVRHIRYRNRRAGAAHYPLARLLPLRDIKLDAYLLRSFNGNRYCSPSSHPSSRTRRNCRRSAW